VLRPIPEVRPSLFSLLLLFPSAVGPKLVLGAALGESDRDMHKSHKSWQSGQSRLAQEGPDDPEPEPDPFLPDPFFLESSLLLLVGAAGRDGAAEGKLVGNASARQHWMQLQSSLMDDLDFLVTAGHWPGSGMSPEWPVSMRGCWGRVVVVLVPRYM